MSLEENSFDFIYDSGCFHHIAPHRRITYLENIHKYLKVNGYFALCCFKEDGAYGGSTILDEEVYVSRSLEGGLGYSIEKLKDLFQSLNEVEIRQMNPMSEEDSHFGLDGFLVEKYKK